MKAPYTLLAFLSFTLQARAITVEVLVQQHSYCGRESGIAQADVSGGLPPYTYLWSNGSTEGIVYDLPPGQHSVTVTDSQMEEVTETFTIINLPSYGTWAGSGVYPLMRRPGDPALIAVHTGWEMGFQQPAPSAYYGPNPYTFNGAGLLDQGQSANCLQMPHHYLLMAPSPGTYALTYTDLNGCPGEFEAYIGPEVSGLPAVQVLNVNAACANTAAGSLLISAPGGPYQYAVRLRPDAVSDPCAPQVQEFVMAAASPALTHAFNGLLPGDYWLIVTNDVLNELHDPPWAAYEYKDSTLVTIPSLGTDCGMLTGRVFVDDVPDCVMAGSENRIPGTVVEITPGPYYVTTNSSGQYSIGLPFGNYTATEQNPVFDQSCPGDVTIASASQTLNIGVAGGQPLDVQLSMANGPARPGFELQYAIDLDNLTPASTGIVTLTVTLDPTLSLASAFPDPSSVAGNVITWTSPQLVMNQAFQQRHVSVRALVPPDVGLIGTTLTTTAQVTTANTDGNLANNSATSNQIVTGSYDPNDKLASTSSGSSTIWLIDEDEWIDYTIRFQNTGTDTAFNVIITDTLPSTLDPSSITWGAGSHAHTRSLLGQGVLKFIFPNILLPDSNVNEVLSHGFVSFRIRPHLPIAPGTIIENIANIYFDFNPPVITEPSVLVAEFSTGIGERLREDMRLMPNPVNEELRISANSSIASLRIIAADGREVLARSVRAANTSIAVDRLQAGAYLLHATFTDGTEARERFIKQ